MTSWRGRVGAAVLVCALLEGVGPAGAQELGTISGVVLDKASGDPVIEALIEVVGQPKKVRTDIDGRYSIKVPPGTYEMRISAPLYQAVRLQKVSVKANAVTKTNASLPPAGKAAVEVVEVVAQAKKATEATQLLKRQKAPVVSETISAETMTKSPDASAAQVVTRAPAVTVRDDRYIFVRGLNERYTTAVLNRSRLPSADPERRVVPLDLFPSTFLDSLSIIKSFSPDLPGDFAGALVDVDLRDFPEAFTLSVGLSGSGNTQTTLQDFLTYQGSTWDKFANGQSWRELPSDFPSALPGNTDRANALGRQLKDIWNVDTVTADPDYDFNFALGDTRGPFGYQFGGLYKTEHLSLPNDIQRQFINSGDEQNPEITARDNFNYSRGLFRVLLGGVFTGAYKLNENNKLALRTLFNQGAVNETISASGKHNNLPDPNSIQNQTRLRYTVEQLALGQLSGEHRVTDWLQFDWRSALSRTTQDEPDVRHTTYVGPEGGRLQFTDDSLGGLRLFNSLDEVLSDSSFDFTVPFPTGLPFTDVWSGLPAKFKTGFDYLTRYRNFQQRRFNYNIFPGAVDLALPPEELFAPDNIQVGIINFIEQTLPSDTYKARENVGAGYGMFDLPVVRERLRFVGGVRVESSLIRVDTFDESGLPVDIALNNLDPLPAANLIYSPRSDMNVRGSYSMTVTRPEFRELSPTQYPQPRGLRPFIGNPDLMQTDITSWDVRWEWFFSPLELVSLGWFYKNLENPIEAITIAQASNIVDSFINAETGKIIGFEFEGRKDFGFVWTPLRSLSLLANVTWADSEVTVGRTTAVQVQTNETRQLQGQAPYIVNAVLEYANPRWVTARLLYNTAGPRIASVGSYGLPDIFEERRNQLDAVLIFPLQEYGLTVPITMKLSAENLLDDRYLWMQGPKVQRRYETGITVGLGVTYTY